MALIPGQNTKQFTREIPPADLFIGRCYSIVDYGTQETSFQGDIKQKHQIYVGWELDSYMQEPGDNQGKPFVVGKKYGFSLHEQASLRKDLAKWRGKDFTDEEIKTFDLINILGTYATIQIAHTPSRDDPSIIYANISSIAPYNSKVGQKMEPINDNIFFDMSETDSGKLIASYQKVYKWQQDIIKKSAEWDTLRMFLEGTEIKAPY